MSKGSKRTTKRLMRKGERVVVRPYQLSDYVAWRESFLTVSNKPKNIFDIIRKRTPSGVTLPRFKKTIKRHLTGRKSEQFYVFGIFLKDGTLLGHVSYGGISRDIFQSAILGYTLFNQHWGHGYASEAVKLAIDIGFADLNLHRIEAAIELKNHRSIKLVKKIGMKKECISRKRILLRGKWQDILLYVLTSEDIGIKWKPVEP